MKKYKFNKKRFAKNVLLAVAVTALILILIDIVRFPECYITTWKYQLENEIKAGNEQAIELYQKNYVANGRVLFE